MGGTCSTHGRNEKKNFSRKAQRKKPLGRTRKEQDVKVWIGFS